MLVGAHVLGTTDLCVPIPSPRVPPVHPAVNPQFACRRESIVLLGSGLIQRVTGRFKVLVILIMADGNT